MKVYENSVLIDIAEFLKKNSNTSYSVIEKRARLGQRKISQLKLGRTSASLDEIHAILIAYPEAAQFYLEKIESLGLNRAGHDFALAAAKLIKNLHSKSEIALSVGVSLKEFLAMLRNVESIAQSDRDKLFAAYPELNLLPSFNPDETQESLAARIKFLEEEIRQLKEKSKDDQIIEMIKQ